MQQELALIARQLHAILGAAVALQKTLLEEMFAADSAGREPELPFPLQSLELCVGFLTTALGALAARINLMGGEKVAIDGDGDGDYESAVATQRARIEKLRSVLRNPAHRTSVDQVMADLLAEKAARQEPEAQAHPAADQPSPLAPPAAAPAAAPDQPGPVGQ